VKRLVEEYGIGVICDPSDPHSIADAVMLALEPDTLTAMQANMRRAQAELNWATEERKLIAIYDDLLRKSIA
jgi:glycosyltransferase involved in cell wall biosynthesis